GSSAGQRAQRKFYRCRFGNHADGARFGRRLRIERLGLHGWFGESVACFARHGIVSRKRQIGDSFFTLQTDDRGRNRRCCRCTRAKREANQRRPRICPRLGSSSSHLILQIPSPQSSPPGRGGRRSRPVSVVQLHQAATSILKQKRANFCVR